MKLKTISMLLVVPLLGLFMAVFSQEQADTAVHDAEVAVATAEEFMARGQDVYNANCAACHQPNGDGLTGAGTGRNGCGRGKARGGAADRGEQVVRRNGTGLVPWERDQIAASEGRREPAA